ncbi:MAG: class I SAM-dependent methyltransferase [Chloroflexi bacterium]|nr:class I SAM-dependent methyltransferase [Chloroflexota bacterium]
MSTDKITLTESFYKTADALQTRIRIHEQYTEPAVDFNAWVLDQIRWRGDEVVLDVGCGAGSYMAPTQARGGRYLAGDLSHGMLKGLDTAAPRLNLDAQQLPLADNSVDVILANHMLYHVPNQPAAVAEFARVLRPGGYLLASTNSIYNLRQYHQLRVEACQALGVPSRPPEEWISFPFSAENGAEVIGRAFPNVKTHLLESALVFPHAQPVLDYFRSMQMGIEPELIAHGRTWAEFEGYVAAVLATHFASHPTWPVAKKAAVFVAQKPIQSTASADLV